MLSVMEVGVAGWACRHTLRWQPARSRRWAVEVHVFTRACIHDNIPCRRLPK